MAKFAPVTDAYQSARPKSELERIKWPYMLSISRDLSSGIAYSSTVLRGRLSLILVICLILLELVEILCLGGSA